MNFILFFILKAVFTPLPQSDFLCFSLILFAVSCFQWSINASGKVGYKLFWSVLASQVRKPLPLSSWLHLHHNCGEEETRMWWQGCGGEMQICFSTGHTSYNQRSFFLDHWHLDSVSSFESNVSWGVFKVAVSLNKLSLGLISFREE